MQSKTRNEKALAEKINKKLALYVNFEIEHIEDENKNGFYSIRSKSTHELRDVTQISTGEKNIIAFLYFIYKLDDADNPKFSLPKLIVFDDPMTSNDDTMQYLIIEELDALMRSLNDDDKIIIMTHNSHFYLNVKYNYQSYRKYNFFRMSSNGIETSITRLTNADDDFKTNYMALWMELKFLYNEAPSPSMLLNPARRIIETFCKFNCIKKPNMLSHVTGAKKLFDVNSHSIDDLEADLNGRSKEDIMKIVKTCFAEEHSLDHFRQHWNLEDKAKN